MTEEDSQTLKLTLNSENPLTVKALAKTLRDFQKLMKAHGADDCEITSLHYDKDPALLASAKREKALEAFVKRVAFDPIGEPEDSCSVVLTTITQEARAILAEQEEPGGKER